ncbi:hypothetical protein M0802_009867 [Mischocyttarus mexicanus]|nr:hypothetical protein M0802_009867 [Mischocyttarus mexicanus]
MEEMECQYNLGNYIYTIKDSDDLQANMENEYIKLNGDLLELEVQSLEIPTDTSFVWTKDATLLLMKEYYVRKERFKNAKIKKKTLWTEIAIVFDKNNYYVSPENLDKKFRNLKRTYIKIRNNIKRSPKEKNKITWEYYGYLKTIFEKDYNISDFTMTSKIEAEDDKEIAESIVHNENSSSEKSMEDDDSSVTSSDQSDQLDNFNNTEQTYYDVKSIKRGIKLRTHKKRQVTNFREERLNLEKEKVKELRRLREAIENNNEIQKERNQLFSALIMNISCETLNEFKSGSSHEKA